MKEWRSSLLTALVIVVLVARGNYSETTWLFVICCAVTFATCASSALHLLGAPAALKFIAITVGLGWFFEETGVKFGWWFGKYTYTSLLGTQFGSVPVIVPLMWFSLSYMGYVISNLIIWHAPVPPPPIGHLVRGRFGSVVDAAVLAIPPAIIVLAYDYGADPYMVKLKAWTVPQGLWAYGVKYEANAAYFHESIQGFRGWFFAAYVMAFVFRLVAGKLPAVPASPFRKREALLPVLLYFGFMEYQTFFGAPPATQEIAAVAMGIPVVFGAAGWMMYKLAEELEHDRAHV